MRRHDACDAAVHAQVTISTAACPRRRRDATEAAKTRVFGRKGSEPAVIARRKNFSRGGRRRRVTISWRGIGLDLRWACASRAGYGRPRSSTPPVHLPAKTDKVRVSVQHGHGGHGRGPRRASVVTISGASVPIWKGCGARKEKSAHRSKGGWSEYWLKRFSPLARPLAATMRCRECTLAGHVHALLVRRLSRHRVPSPPACRPVGPSGG